MLNKEVSERFRRIVSLTNMHETAERVDQGYEI